MSRLLDYCSITARLLLDYYWITTWSRTNLMSRLLDYYSITT